MSQLPSLEEVKAFFAEAFVAEGRAEVVELGEGTAKVRLEIKDMHKRPGGYVSGPTQLAMADTATYAAIFTRLGITPMAVTTSLNMSFLRPLICDVALAEARIIKLGRMLAVAEVNLRGEGSHSPAGHAVVTYALPRD
ncbi:MAG: PaaI family thioesterase [Pseudomonadota bacterium]